MPGPDQSAARQPVLTFVSPDAQDILFYELRDRKLPKNKDFTYGTPHPDTSQFPNHELVYVTEENEKGWSRFYYAATRETQDNYNFEYQQVDIGGRQFDTVVRTYIYKRQEFSATGFQAGTPMPVGPDNKFNGLGYVLMSRTTQRIGEQVLDSLFVVEQRTFIKKVTITQLGYDELSRKNLRSVSTWYYRGEEVAPDLSVEAAFADTGNSFWAPALVTASGVTTGVVRDGQQLSDDWFVVVSKETISGTLEGGSIKVNSYNTTTDYFWPPVLSVLEFMNWTRLDGGVDIFPRVEFSPDGYRGPCRALVEEFWRPTAFTGLDPKQMNPRGIVYSAPFFRLNIPPCLHPNVQAVCDIGTEDQVYAQNTGSLRNYAATNYTTWPASIVAVDEQKPFRGGYLRTRITVYPPDA